MSYAAHAPVMLKEVIGALAPQDGGVYVDATFGGGGYSRAILSAANCTVYGFDRDPTAIARAKAWAGEFGDRLKLVERPFAEIEAALNERGVDAVDGVVFDLGVSSMQLDEAERGFSFRAEGPLSMRMDGQKPDAADVVAKADAPALAGIFKTFGEEKKAMAIARAIVREREKAPIMTTTALAGIVERAAPVYGKQRIHPATRVFQALRIFVNDEFGQLIEGLKAAERLLRPAGRLVAVTFHSLEDRIVKRFFVSRSSAPSASRHAPEASGPAPTFSLVHAKAIEASAAETEKNPRARSAKLRAGIRLQGAAQAANDNALWSARIVSLEQFREGKQ